MVQCSWWSGEMMYLFFFNSHLLLLHFNIYISSFLFIYFTPRPLGVYLGGVALMAFSVAFFNWASTLLGVLVGSAASREIHKKMAKQVLGAPLGFFGTYAHDVRYVLCCAVRYMNV